VEQTVTQRGDNVRTVVRPTWIGDDEQKRLVAAAKRAIARAERAETDAWTAIKLARDSGVPDTHLSAETHIPRSTLIRRLGARTDSTNSDNA
jgi:hypothetical protein